ncbi:MAG: ABC transporter permease [Myxococcales bacterium]|nr:ABC transporter permease [Myxococcales bacterium]
MDLFDLGLVFATLRLAAPLAAAAMGELLAERSGVLNIGIEGMMLCGALAAFAIGTATGSPVLASLAGSLTGVAAAALFAVFVLWRRADPIVTGTALNLFALGATGSAYRLLYPPEVPLSDAPAVADWLPGLNPFVVGTALLVVGVGAFLSYTRAGLAVRAAGERAEAAHSQGVRVAAARWGCTLAGGACAGLAGAMLVLWISNTFVEGMTSGRGFVALALVLFGGYRPGRIVLGALLFGAANALQFRLQALGLEIPYALLLMTPYLLTLLVLALFAGRVRAPSDLARPFIARE